MNVWRRRSRGRQFPLAATLAVVLGGVSLAVAGLFVTRSSGAVRDAAPTTVLTVPGSIGAFAQDGGELAWTSEDASCPSVRVRPVRGGPTAVLSGTDGGDACYALDAFALGGTRVVWGGFEDCCNHGYGTVETDAPQSRAKELRSLGQDYHSWGDFLTGAAGDGRTLVYALTTIDLSPGKEVDDQRGFIHCLPRDPCTWDVSGGGVWRVVGTKAVRVPGTPPTALVAAAGGRIALVPADRHRFPGPCSNDAPVGCPQVRTAAGARVEIRDVVSGARTASFAPRGRVTALALDTETVVVLTRSGRMARVEWYAARSGEQVGRMSVAGDVANALGVSGHIVVLRRGRTILALDTATRRVRELAQARSKPTGLSVEGTRVAWAETAEGRGSIRAISLR